MTSIQIRSVREDDDASGQYWCTREHADLFTVYIVDATGNRTWNSDFAKEEDALNWARWLATSLGRTTIDNKIGELK